MTIKRKDAHFLYIHALVSYTNRAFLYMLEKIIFGKGNSKEGKKKVNIYTINLHT